MKPMFTEQQRKAIDVRDSNVLVSAGAGSGKTAILTERVVTKLIEGVDIRSLVIITFTKAAASEMMERIDLKIRDAMDQHPHLKQQLVHLESAYITTFDAFCKSLLKKYHYELNVDRQIEIGDAIIFQQELNNIMNTMFEEKITNQDQKFIKLLNSLTDTSSSSLKNDIITIYNKFNTFIEPVTDLKEIYSKEYIDQEINLYVQTTIDLVDDIKDTLKEMSYVETDSVGSAFIQDLEESFGALFSCNDYDSFYMVVENKILAKSRKKYLGKEEIDKYHEEIKKIYENIQSLYDLGDLETIKNDYLATYENAQTIVDFVNELSARFTKFKRSINYFEFIDVIKMVIEIVENNQNIREEIKSSISEIMIDEYQDTDDFQNKLVSLIAENNIYMVGDIKQSIYGFRNANPKNFSNRYNDYKNNIDGIAIDLNKNFRSNDGVLDAINQIFKPLMSAKIGGIDYDKTQHLVYGNTSYEISDNQTQFKIKTYDAATLKETIKEEKLTLNKYEYEALLIARDIKAKLKDNYQVIDFKNKTMRQAQLGDFAILSRGKKLIEYVNKVLSAEGLIVNAQADISYKVEYEIILVKNILAAIDMNSINEYKFSLISILRSFLYDFSDDLIDKYFRPFELNNLNNSPFSEIIEKINQLRYKKQTYSNEEMIHQIYHQFEIFKHINKLEDVESARHRLIKLIDIGTQFDVLHADLKEFNAYFKTLDQLDRDITIDIRKDASNAVQVMTYHRSKGLEFPVVYLCGLDKEFNTADLKGKVIANSRYKLIVDHTFTNDKINFYKPTFIKNNFINYQKVQAISEEIRMLYVATTRAKEELIIIMPNQEHNYSDTDIVHERIKAKFNNYYQMIIASLDRYHPAIELLDDILIDDLKSYIKGKVNKSQTSIKTTDEQITYSDISIEKQQIIKRRASQLEGLIIDSQTQQKINLGNNYHDMLEQLDFTNLDNIEVDDNQLNQIISNMKQQKLFSNIIKYYTEYEFITQITDVQTHGYIDLLIEKEDGYYIIDYKLSDIDKPEYEKQIITYIEYIKTKTNKPVYGYLYSLNKNIVKEICIKH